MNPPTLSSALIVFAVATLVLATVESSAACALPTEEYASPVISKMLEDPKICAVPPLYPMKPPTYLALEVVI